MTTQRPASPHRSRGRVRCFALEDDLGRSLGVFRSRVGGWRPGDWVVAEGGRRVQIVAVLPAHHARVEEGEIDGLWIVERA